MKLKTILAYILACCAIFLLPHYGYAETVIRVAVLDSPNLPQKVWIWSHYKKAYLAGIEIAVAAAKKQGIRLEYKTFFYGQNPLDVLTEIPKVIAWHPDVVLGPHYSNQFLLLKRYFPDTLVISSYVSAPEVYQLPSNFYTLCPPDTVIVEALHTFLNTHLPNVGIHLITQADCRSCINITNLVAQYYKNSNRHITHAEFIGDNINDLDIPKLLKGYKKGDLIFIEPVNYYHYMQIITRITHYVDEPNLSFMTDSDYWGNPETPESFEADASNDPYIAYRVNPVVLNKKDTFFKLFQEIYLKKYGQLSEDSVSYMNFLSLMSVLHAIDKYPSAKPTARERTLQSYAEALKNNPHWFRPKSVAIYRNDTHNTDGEVVIQTIPMPTY